MVAAWISAETGVGPAIASGNQVYKGIWALLPVAPMNNNKVMMVISLVDNLARLAVVNTSANDPEPILAISQKIAIRKARSPMPLSWSGVLPFQAYRAYQVSFQKMRYSPAHSVVRRYYI